MPKGRLEALTGNVGYVAGPCIHAPKNTTRDWSLSLHVISPRDGERLGDDETVSLPGLSLPRRRPGFGRNVPYQFVANARRRNHRIHLLARIVASMRVLQKEKLRCRGGEGFRSSHFPTCLLANSDRRSILLRLVALLSPGVRRWLTRWWVGLVSEYEKHLNCLPLATSPTDQSPNLRSTVHPSVRE